MPASSESPAPVTFLTVTAGGVARTASFCVASSRPSAPSERATWVAPKLQDGAGGAEGVVAGFDSDAGNGGGFDVVGFDEERSGFAA